MRLLPRRAAPQLIFLLILALLVAQGVTLWILANEGRGALREAGMSGLLHRIANAYTVLELSRPAVRPQVMEALSSPRVIMTVDGEAVLPRDVTGDISAWLTHELRIPAQRVRSELTPPSEHCPVVEGDEHLEEHPRPRRRDDDERPPLRSLQDYWHSHPHSAECAPSLRVALALPGGGWFNVQALPPRPGLWWVKAGMISLSTTAVILLLTVALAIRRLLRPMRDLSQAAERFGRGEIEPVRERGPLDIREVIHAFNEMQERVSRAIDDRSRLLASLSHDLRTPITSMRLRVELLPDSEDKDKLLDSLSEMAALAEQTLDFVRGSSHEKSRRLDLDALLDSLCSDFADAGAKVGYRGPGRCLVDVRGDALKRALRNLIDNALKYGEQADVMLLPRNRQLVIDIADRGPGIAEGDRERVFEPFVRLEGSRSRETGGAGLGMAIARTLIRQMGGEITLLNRPSGPGLLVRVTLPATEVNA